MKERIQKVLANAGVASRRNIEMMIREGRVTVNGKVVHDLPVLIDPAVDKIVVDAEPVRLKGPGAPRRLYILMNKPKGVFTTNVAQGVQTRAIDLLPKELASERIYPVGQLDAESKGLLLLTNDGDLTNKLTHPRYGVAKTYRVVVDGNINPQAIQELEAGIWLSDTRTGQGFKTGQSQIAVSKRLRDKTVLDITIREGRNRQLRRMLAKMGHKVRELTRTRMGPLTLEGVPPGKIRALTPKEVRQLREAGDHKEKGQKAKAEREAKKMEKLTKGKTTNGNHASQD